MSMLLLMEDSFLPYDLFRASEQGIWLDSSDFSTMFQDSSGTTPVTALGQPVGLVLDKRLGAIRTGSFWDNATAAGLGESTVISTGVYRLYSSAGAYSGIDNGSPPIVVGKWYEVVFSVDSVAVAGGGIALEGFGDLGVAATVGVKRAIRQATTTNFIIKRASTACDIQISNISVRELPGNHASQSTAASRPTVEARVNLLTYSEQFDNAAWVKAVGGTGVAPVVTQNYAAAPDGTMTAARVQLNKGAGTTNSDLSILQQSVTYLAGAHTNRIYVKANGAGAVGKKVLHRGAASGAYTTTTLDGTWQEITWTETAAGGAISTIAVGLRGAQGLNADSVDVLVWHPQVEFGTTATTYQRVNTATDYVDVGAPRYNALDKTDDHLLVAAGGAGTTGFLLACGIVVPAAGTARTIFSDRGTNAGYSLSIDTANKLVFSGGTGAAFTTLTSAAALTTGQKYAVIAWHDGTNLNLSINNVAETPVACGTVTAGTATFTIGKDNGAASGYWGDRLYSMVYRKNDTSNAGNRSNLFSYLVGKMGGL